MTVPETVHAVPVAPASPDSPAPSTSAIPSRSQFYGAAGAVATYVVVLAAKHYGIVLPDAIQLAIPAVFYGIIAYVIPPTARAIAMRLDDHIVQLAASMRESDSAVSKNTVVLPDESRVLPAPPPPPGPKP